MVGTMLCAAVALAGIEVGWEPNARGELEYIIQIDPETLKVLPASEDIRVLHSDIRPELLPFRTYRLQVGTGKLPRTPPAPEPPPPRAETSAKEPAAGPSESRGSPSDIAGAAGTAPTTPPGGADESKSKPRDVAMMVTSGTAVGLLAALLYLGWIHVETRNRYRALLIEHMALAQGRGG